MKLTIKANVAQPRKAVFKGFNASLFNQLAPPFPPVKLIHFGGSKTGDEVILELNFFLFKQRWVSKIIDDNENEVQTWFVDQGTTLPFFLTRWTHRHIIQDTQSGSIIIDQITYDSYPILKWLLWPILYFQFSYRIKIYQRLFS